MHYKTFDVIIQVSYGVTHSYIGYPFTVMFEEHHLFLFRNEHQSSVFRPGSKVQQTNPDAGAIGFGGRLIVKSSPEEVDFVNTMAYIWEKIYQTTNRRKRLQGDVMATRLDRCLTSFDLTLLGIGHMAGAGIYVLTGTLVKLIVGPATFISYIISGVAALFSALCFAEFGAQVPKTGSSYTYTYVTIGEFWAFIVGWNMILENLVGVASVSRSFSGTINALASGRVTAWMVEHVGTIHLGPSNVPPDFIAFAVVIFIVIFIAIGAKCSARLNNTLTLMSICCILMVVIIGMCRADMSNWQNVPGGFLPYGTPGIFAGAATSFFAYIGFDGIATASEEASNPRRSVPLAMCIAMATVMILYVLASSALTLMVPYYAIDISAPFPTAFQEVGIIWAVYIISIGSFCGLSTALITTMFALPRSVYAMAEDGLLFRCLAYVHPVTHTPMAAIIIFGLFAGMLALLIDIQILVELMSIGTLFSFTVVAVAVLILRFEPLTLNDVTNEMPTELVAKNGEHTNLLTEAPRTCGQLRRCLSKYTWLKVSMIRSPLIFSSLTSYFSP